MAKSAVLLAHALAFCGVGARALPYRPVVMMHGMNEDATHLQRNMDALRATYPGIYVTSLAVYEGRRSMIHHMEPQLEAVIAAIKADGNLSKGFNFYGESQGALLARAYVTVANDPPVHNLIALNGPQAGVGECPKVEFPGVKQLCGDLSTDLRIYHWPFCAFCSYWRGKNEAMYLKNSGWVADINNDRTINQTRRQNMLSLNQYMATVALQDEVVQPSYSAWHTYWYWGDDSRSKIMPLYETEGYKSDALGLRSLAERGALILNSFDGRHLGYTMDWWNENVLPMFDNRLSEMPAPSLVV
mmetsp:Transcript_123834/g.396401  ORF Transcript_123834/g.396401 Transcript_123834/m.396401 type:complete len:301 (+) Transcript_123834:57-959(+)